MKLRFKNSVSSLVFISIWASFFYNGIIDKMLFGRNGVPFWLILILLLVFILYFGVKKAASFSAFEFLLFVLFIFTLPSIFNYMSLYSVVLISIPLCILLSGKMSRGWMLSTKEKKIIFFLGVITGFFSLIMFGYFTLIDRPVFGLDPIRPGYGYAIDRGVLLRLVGFSDDPNFYVLGAALPLLVGIDSPHIRYRKIGLLIIGLSILFTFSRSGAVAIAISLVILFFKRVSLKKVAVYSISCLMVFVASLFIGEIIESLKTSDNVEVSRDFSSGLSSRTNLLNIAAEAKGFSFWGNGVGVSKEVIGLHSHNSYFDYLYETGYVPFALVVAIVMAFVFQSLRSPNLIRAYGVAVITTAAAVSISFQPLFLMILLNGLKYSDDEK